MRKELRFLINYELASIDVDHVLLDRDPVIHGGVVRDPVPAVHPKSASTAAPRRLNQFAWTRREVYA